MDDVLRRIVVRHWLVLSVCVVVGVFTPLAVHAGKPATFTARTRIVIASDPKSAAESAAIADSARAIVTSGDRIASVLRSAGIDPGTRFSRSAVSLEALGSSSIVELSVTHSDPEVSASIVNALAADLVAARRAGSLGDASRQLAVLMSRERRLRRDIEDLPVSGRTSPSTTARHDFLVAEKARVEASLDALRTAVALTPRPAVLDPARAPGEPDRSGAASGAILGLALGLVAGLGLSSAQEIVRPSIVGTQALADDLGVPSLGVLGDKRLDDEARLQHVATRIELAARGAAVETVELVGVGKTMDLASLARDLRGNTGMGTASRLHVVRAFEVDQVPASSAWSHGVVLVAPTQLRRSELESGIALVAITGWPLLGLVGFRRRRWIWRRLRWVTSASAGSTSTPRTPADQVPVSRISSASDEPTLSSIPYDVEAEPGPDASLLAEGGP